MVPTADKVYVSFSTGTGFAAPQVGLDQTFAGSVSTQVADVNGDGRADLIARDASAVRVALSTGAGWAAPQTWATQGVNGTTTNLTGDVDGDRRADLVAHSPTAATVARGSAAPGTYHYAYGPDGLRTSKTTPGGATTRFTWSRAGGLPLLLSQHDPGGTTHIIYGPGGQPIEQIGPDGTPTWYHRDHLGSTRLTTSATGATTSTAGYTPYGQPATTNGNHRPLLTYAGQYTDPETGFQYLRARYHDTTTGQFHTRDPLVATTMDPTPTRRTTRSTWSTRTGSRHGTRLRTSWVIGLSRQSAPLMTSGMPRGAESSAESTTSASSRGRKPRRVPLSLRERSRSEPAALPYSASAAGSQVPQEQCQRSQRA